MKITRDIRRSDDDRVQPLENTHEYIICADSKATALVQDGGITLTVGYQHVSFTEAEFSDFLTVYLKDRLDQKFGLTG